MSYAPGAPEQVWALTGLDAGAKLTLLRLWSWADHDVQREPVETTVWAAGRVRDDGSKMGAAEALQLTLAEQTGQTARAVRSHLTRLRLEGLADADGRCVRLTPPRQACRSSVDTKPSAADTVASAADIKPSAPDTKPSGNYIAPIPPTTPYDPAIDASAPAKSPETPDTSPVTNPTPEATPPRKPRTRKRADPRPGQTGLDIGDAPETPAFEQLLAEHERLRRAAQVAHGQRATALPAGGSGAGVSLRARLRKALREHKPEELQRALEYQAAEWARDPGALARWSTDSMWSPKSLAVSLARSSGGDRARASPGTLPVPAQLPDRSLPGFTWIPPT